MTRAKVEKKKKKREREGRGDTSYGESVEVKWFSCAFKLGFLQLMCKASLIFNSNLELALQVILKQRELY